MNLEGYLVMAGIGLVSMIGAFAASRATGAKDVTDAAVSLLQPLRDRMLALEMRVASLESENILLRAWGEYAYAKAVESGGDPLPFGEYSEKLSNG